MARIMQRRQLVSAPLLVDLSDNSWASPSQFLIWVLACLCNWKYMLRSILPWKLSPDVGLIRVRVCRLPIVPSIFQVKSDLQSCPELGSQSGSLRLRPVTIWSTQTLLNTCNVARCMLTVGHTHVPFSDAWAFLLGRIHFWIATLWVIGKRVTSQLSLLPNASTIYSTKEESWNSPLPIHAKMCWKLMVLHLSQRKLKESNNKNCRRKFPYWRRSVSLKLLYYMQTLWHNYKLKLFKKFT